MRWFSLNEVRNMTKRLLYIYIVYYSGDFIFESGLVDLLHSQMFTSCHRIRQEKRAGLQVL